MYLYFQKVLTDSSEHQINKKGNVVNVYGFAIGVIGAQTNHCHGEK